MVVLAAPAVPVVVPTEVLAAVPTVVLAASVVVAAVPTAESAVCLYSSSTMDRSGTVPNPPAR